MDYDDPYEADPPAPPGDRPIQAPGAPRGGMELSTFAARLDDLLGHMRSKPDVEFATGEEAARAWREANPR